MGADASATNIEVAKLHAAEAGVTIDYRARGGGGPGGRPAKNSTSSSTWKWSSTSRMSQVLLSRCAEMVKPDGIMFVATINRTLKALGPGDHRRRIRPALAAATAPTSWDKFVTPNELEIAMERGGPARQPCRAAGRDLQICIRATDVAASPSDTGRATTC